ncbi:hypothetical protein [Micromonospora sp. NPDC049801]|uniref:hypothetical protein n=1 Tax=unclassified Micromonospora TaxID=2617518 RepID=UPI0033F26245
MPEVNAPDPRGSRAGQHHDRPRDPIEVEVEALALVTLGNELHKLWARREAAGQPPSDDVVEAIGIVKERMGRLPSETPAQGVAAGVPSTVPTAPPVGSAAHVQWHDEFLNLLVRTARKVRRWLKELDARSDRSDGLPTDLRNLPDLSSIDPRSDLYRRTSNRLGELLDQSPVLRRLSSSGNLDGVSRHLPQLRIERREYPIPSARPGPPLADIAAMPSLRADRAGGPDHDSGRAEPNSPAHLPRQQRRATSAGL